MTAEAPASILIVDDRQENLLALEAILSSLGHRVVRAGSGEEALKCLLGEDFAVVLLDVQMPGMDGFETAHLMKQRERTRFTPVIFLTAIDRDASQAFRGYSVGAVDYLSKPFDPWLLRAKVEVFVDLHRKNLLLAEQATRLHAQVGRVAARLRRLREQAAGGGGTPGATAAEIDACLADLAVLQEVGVSPA